MSAPSKVIEPEAIGYCPTMARSRLVLPTPLRPSTHITLPGSALIETPRSACAAPSYRLILSTFRMASPPQIYFDHALVRRHLVDSALREHRTFVQARHLD